MLSKGDVVLATPSDLIGSALGQSEEKTNALLDKAEGCVLVIAVALEPGVAFVYPQLNPSVAQLNPIARRSVAVVRR